MSEVKEGLCILAESPSNLVKIASAGIKVIAFNDLTVRRLKECGVNASTITTYTGSRDHTVVFYVDDKAIASNILNRKEWIYTAMTRATNQLVLYGNTAEIERFFMINGTTIRTFEEVNDIMIHQDIFLNKQSLPISVFNTGVVAPTTSPDIAITTLTNIYQPVNPSYPSHAFVQAEIPAVASGSAKVDPLALINNNKTYKGYQYSPEVALVKNQYSNHIAASSTLFERYSKKKIRMSRSLENITTEALLDGLCKAIYGNNHSRKHFKRDMAATNEELMYHATEYFRSLQTKIGNNKAIQAELRESFDFFAERIKFSSKKQCKFSPDYGFDESAKVGQGIASLSKKVNIMFSAYARFMLTRIREIAKNNNRNLVLATFGSDEDLNNEVTSMMASIKDDDLVWVCNDFNEWDSKYRRCLADMTHTLLDWIGCPADLNDDFSQFRNKWDMILITTYGKITLSGEECQLTGSPFTLAENTIGDISLMYTCFDFKGEVFAIFKGDDSAILCRKASLLPSGQTLLNNTGHTLKIHHYKIGEFAGFIITPLGLFPDVVRYVAKFLGKIYDSEKHFKEALVSLCERTNVVKTQEQLNYGLHSMSYFYPITAEASYALFGFLKNANQVTFNQLTPVLKPILDART